MDEIEIPAQLFYKIGQVSQLAGVKPHVLRYWESEFGLVKPRKDKRGQRLYRRSDIDIILHIKELLYKQKYSISGAKKKLKETSKNNRSEDKKYSTPELHVIIDQQKKQIQELLNLLEPRN